MRGVESNFDGIIPALKARKFDAILSGMYMTEKRKAQIAFSDKLYNGPVFLVARKIPCKAIRRNS